MHIDAKTSKNQENSMGNKGGHCFVVEDFSVKMLANWDQVEIQASLWTIIPSKSTFKKSFYL